MDHIILTNGEDLQSCALCHQPLAYFGNLNLKEGMICRECVKKVSSWLSVEKIASMSVEQMHQHLAYRLENQKALQEFDGVKIIPGNFSIYADLKKQQFLIARKENYQEQNSDIFQFDSIDEVYIQETSYNEFGDLDVMLTLKLNHPQIQEVTFRINEFPAISKSSTDYTGTLDLAFTYLKAFMIMNNRHNQITLRKDNEDE